MFAKSDGGRVQQIQTGLKFIFYWFFIDFIFLVSELNVLHVDTCHHQPPVVANSRVYRVGCSVDVESFINTCVTP